MNSIGGSYLGSGDVEITAKHSDGTHDALLISVVDDSDAWWVRLRFAIKQ